MLVIASALAFVFGREPSAVTTLLFLVAGGALLSHFAYRIRQNVGQHMRPDGILFISASQFVAGMGLLAPLDAKPTVYGIAALFGAVGTVRIIVFRIGMRAEITERETAIVSAGIGLTFSVVIIQPAMGGALGLLNLVVAITSLSVALFSTILLLWLATFDTDTISTPFVLILLPQSLLVVTAADLNGAFEGGIMYPLTLLAILMPAAAYQHPNAPDAFSLAMFVSSEVNARRSLISFSVILIGPVMIAIDQFTSLRLSLVTVTVGSSLLSVMVATHLLLLVRRWADVEHQGQHDPLTRLPNRALFFSRLETAIEGARIRESQLVVMFLDLDRFKAVNDSLGHEKGDLLLRLVSERLDDAATRVGHNLTVARLGGDEFAVVVPSVKDARHSHAIGRMFLDQFLEPFDMGLRDIYVTPSIGIAEYPRDGSTVEELIENADTAMFEAKERGRNTVVNYSPEQRTPGANRLEIEAALHKALQNNELEVFYQPQIDVSSGHIFAVEALLRWEHPTLGRISPERFVPVAEESTLIDAIGQWTLEEACREAASWGDLGLPEINVAVNLSPRQFQKAVLLTDNVSRALRNSGLDPRRLELELTESLALERPEEVNATLVHFREMGIRTAIDDFGVGHTGLDYLDRITVDTLKIDRSFINRIGESGAPLVTAVISLARGLNLDVIAEGVETRAQVNFLKAHGCRYMQGFLFSKPLSGSQLQTVLQNQLRRGATAGGTAANRAA